MALLGMVGTLGCEEDSSSLPHPERAEPKVSAGAFSEANGDDHETGIDETLPTAHFRPIVYGLAVDGDGDRLYWSEPDLGRIRSSRLDGSDIRDAVSDLEDGPLVLALSQDQRKIYWTTDHNVGWANVADGVPDTLIGTDHIAGPGALAIDPIGRRMLWTELLDARVRTGDLDGSSHSTLFAQEQMVSHGIAAAGELDKLFWSDMLGGQIFVSRPDGSATEILLGRRDGLRTPLGIAFDQVDKKIYWADAAVGRIGRANADGSQIEHVVTVAQGAIAPSTVAIDEVARKIYWVDRGSSAVYRATLDGDSVERVLERPRAGAAASTTDQDNEDRADDHDGLVRSIPDSIRQATNADLRESESADRTQSPPTSLRSCAMEIERTGSVFLARIASSAGSCFDAIRAIRETLSSTADYYAATPICAQAFEATDPASSDSHGNRALLATKIRAACEPALRAEVGKEGLDTSHFALWNTVDECFPTRRVGQDADTIVDCTVLRIINAADDLILDLNPDVDDLLGSIRPFLEADSESRLSPLAPTPSGDATAPAFTESTEVALAKVLALQSQLATNDVASTPTEKPRKSTSGLTVSGQTRPYLALGSEAVSPETSVPDDGTLQVGQPFNLRDNGDGTVSDLVTGLMWEKKCGRCRDLHDERRRFRWNDRGRGDSVWEWLDRINTKNKTGLGGHTDWRIPNVRELASIVDYGHVEPATPIHFSTETCGDGCGPSTEPTCSCTFSGEYWSSTTFADFPAHAIFVGFDQGFLGDAEKDERRPVRAVRGGLVPELDDAPPAYDWLEGARGPRGLALDDVGGLIYWSEQDSGRILRATLAPSTSPDLPANNITEIARMDGPVGIAIDRDLPRLFWSRNGGFPRAIGMMDLDGRSGPEALMAGPNINRPAAITYDAEERTLYWTESVSGRVRRLSLDDGASDDVYVDSILDPQGIATDEVGRKLYWSDAFAGRIRRSNLDGSRHEDILTRDDGVLSPAGLAIDSINRVLYWADPDARQIRRSSLDGSDARVILSEEDGLQRPYAIALSRRTDQIYWTDTAARTIGQANTSGESHRVILRDLGSPLDLDLRIEVIDTAASQPVEIAESACGEAIESGARELFHEYLDAAGFCLEKVSRVKAVKYHPVHSESAAGTCARNLRRIVDSRPAGPPGLQQLKQRVRAACKANNPATDQGLTLRVGYGAPTDDQMAPASCPWVNVAQADAWAACTERAIQASAWKAIEHRYLRSREWLDDVRPFLTHEPSPADDPTFGSDALAALNALHAALPPRRASESAAPPLAGKPGLIASGQTTTYATQFKPKPAQPSEHDAAGAEEPGDRAAFHPDDGSVRAGFPLRFQDNGDDTVTDLNTGLMWEKKCDCPGKLHDMSVRRAWSDRSFPGTVWEWLADVNTEDGAGFAGYSDWRIPNIKELGSLIDYETFNPAVDLAFDGDVCGIGCENPEDPACSCTWQGQYWSSTTFADDPDTALTVYFNLGVIGDADKSESFFVRAVRGGD